jgi:hypothetical protein
VRVGGLNFVSYAIFCEIILSNLLNILKINTKKLRFILVFKDHDFMVAKLLNEMC